jgi:hypothetical protein
MMENMTIGLTTLALCAAAMAQETAGQVREAGVFRYTMPPLSAGVLTLLVK